MTIKAFELVKKINNLTVLNTIREKGPISRADISKLTGLNPATVSSNVSMLLEGGIAMETGSGESSGGRKPILVELNYKAFHIIGVDMGISKVTAAVMDLGGNIVEKTVVRYGGKTDAAHVMEKITESINIVLNNSERIVDTIIGIGIGVHGIVDYRKGISVYAPAFDWRDLDIKSIIEGRFNMPVFIDNDVRTMALGEKWFGAARSIDNFVFINVGSGIGSGIMINGELYTGKNFSAGEVGHISIADNGPKCNCGNYGCLEVMASGPAIVKRVVSQIKMGKATAITKLVNDDLSSITGEIIHMAAKMGDTVAADALQETGRYIGIAVSSIINILNPELILIGGGVSNAGDFIFKPLIEVAKKKSMKDAGKNVGILPAALGENCGVVGAATLVIKDLFQVPKFV